MSFRDEIRKRAGDLLLGTGKGTAEPLIDQLRKPEKVEEEAAPPVEAPKGALEARAPPKPRREYAVAH